MSPRTLTVSPRTEQVSIYLRYISCGLTKKTFIRTSKTGTAIVHYYFFSLAGPRDKQVVFAIRAKLGLTPQMDVRPYAYAADRDQLDILISSLKVTPRDTRSSDTRREMKGCCMTRLTNWLVQAKLPIQNLIL